MLDKAQNIIQYRFKDIKLLEMALTHGSAGKRQSYQCLEFFGDSILDFLVSEIIYKRYPKYDEGQLTKLRSKVVSEKPLAEVINKSGLSDCVFMGYSEVKKGVQYLPSIQSDLFEAVLAAVYLDGGMDEARAYVDRFLTDIIKREEAYGIESFTDFKSKLNEYAGKKRHEVEYLDISDAEDGTFRYRVMVDGEPKGEGVGRTKKQAQQNAAKAVLSKLK